MPRSYVRASKSPPIHPSREIPGLMGSRSSTDPADSEEDWFYGGILAERFGTQNLLSPEKQPTLLGCFLSSASTHYKPGQSCRDRQNRSPPPTARAAPCLRKVTPTGALPAAAGMSVSLRSESHNLGPSGPRFPPDPLRGRQSLQNSTTSAQPIAEWAVPGAAPRHFRPRSGPTSARPKYQQLSGETSRSQMSH